MTRAASPWPYRAAQAGGWGLYAVLNGALALAGGAIHPALALLSVLSLSALGLLATHGLRAFARRHQWQALPLGSLALRVLGSSALLAVSILLVQVALLLAARVFTWAEVSALTFVVLTGQFAILLLLWQVLYFGIHAVQRSRRAELDRLTSLAAAKTAELGALRSQLNPHFLFNSLNTLRALIAEDPALAQEAVTRLSSLLRYALASGEAQTVSLERELEVVNDYLSLEVLRFEARLKVVIDVGDGCLPLQVPVLLLQTLVENAVKHGIARSTAGGEVRLTARKEGGVLRIEVSNPSPDSASAPAPSTGVGLANTRERLRLLFGEAATFQLASAGPITTAEVRIPCR